MIHTYQEFFSLTLTHTTTTIFLQQERRKKERKKETFSCCGLSVHQSGESPATDHLAFGLSHRLLSSFSSVQTVNCTSPCLHTTTPSSNASAAMNWAGLRLKFHSKSTTLNSNINPDYVHSWMVRM